MKRVKIRSLSTLDLFVVPSAVVVGYVSAMLGGAPHAGYTTAAAVALLVMASLPLRLLAALAVLGAAFTAAAFDVAGASIRVEQLLLIPTIVACIRDRKAATVLGRLNSPVFRLFGVFILLQVIVSLVRSPDPRSSLLISAWFASNLLLAAIAVTLFSYAELSRLLYAGAWMIVATGVLSWLLPDAVPFILEPQVTASEGVRAKGISLEPNVLAGVAAVWIVILLTRERRLRSHDWLFLLIAVVAIPLSTTRSAVLAAALGVLTYIIQRPRRLDRLIVPATIGAVTVLVVTGADYIRPIVNKLSNFEFDDDSSNYRFNFYRVALDDLANQNWVIGLGTNSFGQRHADPTDPTGDTPGYLGNLPLQTVYDSGLAGAVILGLIAIKVLSLSQSAARSLALAATFTIISIATSPFFFAYYWVVIAASFMKDAHLRKDVLVRPERPTELLPLASARNDRRTI